MPELPEVQTIVDELNQSGIVGCAIEDVEVFWPRTVANENLEVFRKSLQGQRIVELKRRAKYLIFTLSSGDSLCVHLRMTGRLLLVKDISVDNPHIRLRLILDQKRTLDYYDTRKFGRWTLVSDLTTLFGKIGPEPLSAEFTAQRFWEMLNRHARALKTLLLDQSFLAGLGNIYVDEALWESQLHPLQRSNTLTHAQAKHLHQSIVLVLKRGIESQGTTLGTGKSNYYRLDGSRGKHQTLLQVFRRTGQPCPRCGEAIERLIVAQRSTHICPKCQNQTL